MGDALRYGIIGSGMMGIEHLLNLAHVPGAEVTAIADPHGGSRDWARSAAPEDVRFEEFEDHAELLASGLCDVVVIATPNMTHHDVLLDVLATDLHVLVEKPLCTTVADCRDVIEAAADRQGVVWVGLEYRYMPPVSRLVRAVHDAEIGQLHMIGIREHRFPFLRKIGDWNRFDRNTGGTLVEKCCHYFDLMNHMVGRRPVRVMASGAQDVNHLDERYDGEVPDIIDNAMVIVEYENGVRASLDLCMFAEGSTNAEELSVVGDAGKAEAFLPSKEFRLGTRAAGRDGVTSEIVTDDRVRWEGFHHGSSYLEHLDFLATCRSGSTPVVSLEDGLWSVAVGVAAQRSIVEQRVVVLDDVL
ncbi:Gfo/Idh/MocA family protein [Actinospongicola halichondriae]|uniref:Gfo/Idh/MocA family protein n=1 Tax=Actinospongicola halichondriae TaxID=3236844 RepID=UPI003D3F835B